MTYRRLEGMWVCRVGGGWSSSNRVTAGICRWCTARSWKRVCPWDGDVWVDGKERMDGRRRDMVLSGRAGVDRESAGEPGDLPVVFGPAGSDRGSRDSEGRVSVGG
jgi:hypothetical protein